MGQRICVHENASVTQAYMSFLSEEDGVDEQHGGENKSVLPLRFGTTVQQLSTKDNTIELKLELESRAGIKGIISRLSFLDYSNAFPFDIQIRIKPCTPSASMVLESGCNLTESWNKRVTIYNIPDIEYACVNEDLTCSKPSMMHGLVDCKLMVTDFISYRYDKYTEHVLEFPGDVEYVLIQHTHPYFNKLWHYAAIFCAREQCDFIRASNILCNKTKKQWKIPSRDLMQINESIHSDVEKLGPTHDVSDLVLCISRLDGRSWSDSVCGVDVTDVETVFKCVMSLHVSVVCGK